MHTKLALNSVQPSCVSLLSATGIYHHHTSFRSSLLLFIHWPISWVLGFGSQLHGCFCFFLSSSDSVEAPDPVKEDRDLCPVIYLWHPPQLTVGWCHLSLGQDLLCWLKLLWNSQGLWKDPHVTRAVLHLASTPQAQSWSEYWQLWWVWYLLDLLGCTFFLRRGLELQPSG